MKMEKKNSMIVVLGACLILFAAVFIYLLPLLGEIFSSKTTLGCIGSGCHSSSASSTSGMGGVDCWGYKLFLFCFSTPEKYCRYAQPLDSMEKCVCEAPSPHFRGSGYRKYCSKNNICYTNNWEYEFGCTSDMAKVCRKAEEVFTLPDACSGWYNSAQAYDFVRKASECSQSWRDIYIYISADGERKKNIFENGFVSAGVAKIKDLCINICENCDSTLCERGNICEYATMPFCEKTESYLIPSQGGYSNTSQAGRIEFFENNRNLCNLLCKNCTSVLCEKDNICEYLDIPYSRLNIALWIYFFENYNLTCLYKEPWSRDCKINKEIKLLFNHTSGTMKPYLPSKCYLSYSEKYDDLLKRWFSGLECDYTIRLFQQGNYSVDVEINNETIKKNITTFEIFWDQIVIDRIIRITTSG